MRDKAVVSYSWVLQGLKDIFSTAQTPSIIVTDRDEGLSTGIRDVFPDKKVFWLIIVIFFIENVLITFNVMFNVDVQLLLCIWHIANDVENMVEKLCGGKRNQQG